ncbi:unnamed protein product, partial [Rotaria sp. Silwood2]
ENVIFTNLSCCIYLQCNCGGLFRACLDWREICNGKIDCINGGIDEAYCDQLEINECKENEYRCHNGQCIPEVFLRDDLINRECLDGTDEPTLPDYPNSCSFDPAFRCEDITCRPGIVKDFACGDGECTLTTCTNKRDVLFKKEMIEMTSNISNQCRDIMVCISGLNKCETELDREEHCPELFQFPEVSILYGHVQFIYEGEYSPDLIQQNRRLYFQTVCDGVIDLLLFPILINGQKHTDETECDMWQCNNSYTRCDGNWNCFNGAGEVNCPPSKCPLFEHMCVSPLNNSLICLPIEKAGDGNVDCLGASDERQLCRRQHPHLNAIRFWCSKSTSCKMPIDLCSGRKECLYGDDEQFCTSGCPRCSNLYRNQTEVENFLCTLTDVGKKKFVPLSLSDSRIYPVELKSANVKQDFVPVDGSLVVEKKIELVQRNINLTSIWRCNRGLNIRVWLGGNNMKEKCLCPPTYYEDLCQYQNQRVSLTLQVHALFNSQTIFVLVLTLIDDDDQHINSYDQIEYLSVRDCNTKFNLYLLFSTRPKNLSKNYIIRIDAFKKVSLAYHASWLFPIQFPFLPVHRMALQINIPTQSIKKCSINCGIHDQCLKYENTETYFCHCDYGWSGHRCSNQDVCNCSPDSLCLSTLICLCPLNKFGPRCYLKRIPCRSNSCMNDGVCVLSDVHFTQNKVTCICQNGFSGPKCQFRDTNISITFRKVTIPSIIIVHFIEGFDKNEYKVALPIRTTTFKKIPVYQDSVIIYRNAPFHILLAELNKNYYLILLQEKRIRSGRISPEVIPSHRCLSVNELFNTSFLSLHIIRRIKYYHISCQERPNLVCFYDDTYMCLCNLYQHANCFEFVQNMTYNCGGTNYCENDGECFQDDPKCPTSSACSCKECYYGSQCQFSTKGFSLSLDIILGYHIRPNIHFIDQPLITKIFTGVIIIIVLIGLINSLLCIVTLQECLTLLIETAIPIAIGIYTAVANEQIQKIN